LIRLFLRSLGFLALWIVILHIVGGKSLEGVEYGVRPRRLGLAGLGELRGLGCRSTLKGSRS